MDEDGLSAAAGSAKECMGFPGHCTRPFVCTAYHGNSLAEYAILARWYYCMGNKARMGKVQSTRYFLVLCATHTSIPTRLGINGNGHALSPGPLLPFRPFLWDPDFIILPFPPALDLPPCKLLRLPVTVGI